jgi:hypothetical protein
MTTRKILTAIAATGLIALATAASAAGHGDRDSDNGYGNDRRSTHYTTPVQDYRSTGTYRPLRPFNPRPHYERRTNSY